MCETVCVCVRAQLQTDSRYVAAAMLVPNVVCGFTCASVCVCHSSPAVSIPKLNLAPVIEQQTAENSCGAVG